MQTFRETGQMNEALGILDQLSNLKMSPNIEMFSLLLAGCVEQKLVKEGLGLFAKFVHSQLPMESSMPPQVLNLITGEASNEHQKVIDLSLRPLLIKMEISKVASNSNLLGLFLCLCMACNELDLARHAIRSLPKNLTPCPILLASLATLIRHFKAKDLLPQAISLLERLESQSKDKSPFISILAACASCRVYNYGEAVYVMLERTGIHMD